MSLQPPQKNKPTFSILLGGFAAAFSPLAAQPQAETSSGEIVELAPYTVSERGAQSVLHITQRDLDQRQATDLEDALSIDPSITVGGSTGIAQKIYVRNLGEGLLNVSIDGATQSGSLFHHIGRIAIEPDLLKQVEVQPGVGNASDGPGALGGAIRFITKDPGDLLAPNERAGALLKHGYFENTRGYKTSATGFGRTGGTWSGLASVVLSEHEEIEDGHGTRLAGSDTRQNVILAKAVGEFSHGQKLRVGFEALNEEGKKLRRPEWGPSPANPVFFMEAGRRTATVGYSVRPESTDWLDLQLNGSYTDADIMQDAAFGPYEGEIESVQFGLKNTQRLAAHRLTYGIDYLRDEVFAGPSSNPETVSEKGEVAGLFVQGEIAATKQLTFNAGARFDNYELHDRRSQTFEHDGFSPNAGFRYAFTPAFNLTGGVTTALRGPDINDAFRVDIAENDPNLDAEKARNYELRFLYRRAGFTVEAGGYVHRIKDVITNTLPWSRVYTNAGELKTDGVFGRVSHATRRTHLSLQYNHADTTINGQTATRYQYSSLVSRIGDTWVADAFWRPHDSVDLGWNGRLVQGLDDISIPAVITDGPVAYIDKPGYATHDLYVRWTPAFAPRVSLNLTVKNVFDKYYRSHGSVEDLTAIPGFAGVAGAPEQGRDIRLTVSVRL